MKSRCGKLFWAALFLGVKSTIALANEGALTGYQDAGEFTSIQDAREAGVDLDAVQGMSGERDNTWDFGVRQMGLSGYSNGPKHFTYGGELELSFNPFFARSGFDHRKWGVGVTYQATRDLRLVEGSLIYRIFTFQLAEPEVRIRVGKDFLSNHLALGLNAGMRYPFSLDPGSHWAASLEAGSLGLVSASSSKSVSVSFWGAVGLGYYF